MLRIVGIDPGRTGALALICGGVVLDCIDMPTCEDNSQVQVDGPKLFAWIEKHLPLDLAVIENVQPMRGIGAGSQGMPPGNAFRFGLIAGELRMAFKAYGVPIMLVTPSSWKRSTGLLKADKAASRSAAMDRLPSGAPWLTRVKDHNRSEAMLLGLYGQNQRGML